MNYFSDQQLARRYGVHRSTIWRWVKDGRFPAPTQLTTGTTRWNGGAVEQHEAKLTQGAV